MLNVNDILSKPSGLYSGTDADGNEVVINRQKNLGFIIMTPTHDGWYECKEYGESGMLEGVYYEK